jgi:DNA-binding NarL/FixJ family response regulator
VKRGPKPHGRSAAALLVSDSDLGAAVPGADLRRLFGLTEREAALAAGIVQGERLNAVADQLGLSVRTARNHLQAVLRKTG